MLVVAQKGQFIGQHSSLHQKNEISIAEIDPSAKWSLSSDRTLTSGLPF
jgi:hypothetical protein